MMVVPPPLIVLLVPLLLVLVVDGGGVDEGGGRVVVDERVQLTGVHVLPLGQHPPPPFKQQLVVQHFVPMAQQSPSLSAHP